MSVLMVDLEGTLSDNKRRLAILKRATSIDARDRDAWSNYYKGLPDDEPNHAVMAVVRDYIRAGIRPLVYSTRFINKYNHEEEWLRGHELWEHVDLLQRDPSQTIIKGPELVRVWVQEFKPEVLIDDREEVHESVHGLIPGMMSYYPDDFEEPPAA